MDDLYEVNNSLEDAYDLSNYSGTWLSDIDGLGVQSDNDWYKIFVEEGFENLVVDLQFTHADGDIDIQVLDENGNGITSSAGVVDNEYINTILSGGGTYYLRVYYDNAGNTYDLQWNSLEIIDDNYEPNDTLEDAYDLSNYPETWLRNLDGAGIQYDNDWYKISVEEGFEKLVLDLETDDEISLTVYDEEENYINNFYIYESETIEDILPGGGDYYLQVYYDDYYGDAGNTYDLQWSSLEIIDDNYEPNDILEDAYDLSNYPATWLSNLDGAGIQYDRDWYKISVEEGFEKLVLDLEADDEISLTVFDEEENYVNKFNIDEPQTIEEILPGGGDYYLKVDSYSDTGTSYDMQWNDVAAPLNIIGTGDFDGDGQTDLIRRNNLLGNNSILLMNDLNSQEVVSIDSVDYPDWDIKGSGDFDGDGQTDLLWGNGYAEKNSIWFMDGTTKIDRTNLELTYNRNWDIQGTGDFNNDSKTDILWRNNTTGENSVWFMDSVDKIEVRTLNSVDYPDWDIKGTGDFNGDSKTDILWRNNTTGENSVWFMDGTTKIGRISLDLVEDSDWDIKGTGDFNGDNQTDILWGNEYAEKNSVWFMDGTTRLESVSLNPVSD